MSAVEKWWHEEKAARSLHNRLNLTTAFHISSTTTTTTIAAATTQSHALTSLLQPFVPLSTINNNFGNLSDITSAYATTTSNDIDDWEAHPGCVILLIIVYGIIVFGGILGNASLVITLCSKPSGRLRNPLLVALCLADLLVAGISAPSTIVTLAMAQKSWNLPSLGCKAIYYFQAMPVAASTLSFLMLSLDRYATVKHPRLAQFRQRRYLHTILAIISWIGASAICIPILLAYRLSSKILTKETSSFIHHKVYSTCYADYGSSELRTSFVITHTILVFIFPALGIVLNHLGVRRKLCALSLTARAAHGELPLPMPILRRPTHMIIVTGMANAARGVVSNDSSEDEEERNRDDKNFMMETIVRSSPKSPRVMREIRAQQQRQRLENKTPAPELPLPQTSTLRARRRLANMLVLAAIIFIGCWSPHVICILLAEIGQKQCSKMVTYFSLLVGYSHSAISPIMYWILNHNTLRQSPCAPFIRLSAIQRFLRIHLRSGAVPPPPSSTNEAALGAFNPRYIKTTPKQYRAQASSHYLY